MPALDSLLEKVDSNTDDDRPDGGAKQADKMMAENQ